MSKHIDADALLAALYDADAITPRGAKIIREFPVVKTPHGEWIGESDGYADGYPVYDIWSCSECGEYFDEWDEEPIWNFCPNCGAKMKGGQDE